MARTLANADAGRVAASRLSHLLAEAKDVWRPSIRSADAVFRSRQEAEVVQPNSRPEVARVGRNAEGGSAA